MWVWGKEGVTEHLKLIPLLQERQLCAASVPNHYACKGHAVKTHKMCAQATEQLQDGKGLAKDCTTEL